MDFSRSQSPQLFPSFFPFPLDPSFHLLSSPLLPLLLRFHSSLTSIQAKQGKEALFNLQTGLRSQYGDNERGNQILLHLDQMLKAETPLDVADLKKLMDELQHFSVETSNRLARKDDKHDVTNIDPTRLPPAYRGRIQKYFQKLSEK